jgi:hypothetical protein
MDGITNIVKEAKIEEVGCELRLLWVLFEVEINPNETYVRHATSWGRLVTNGKFNAYLFLRIQGFIYAKVYRTTAYYADLNRNNLIAHLLSG